MTQTLAQAEKLLDFSQPLDIGLLDATVDAFYSSGTSEERSRAEQILTRLKEHQQAWTRADAILEGSSNSNSKFFALSILDDVIKYKWNVLPHEQREGIKNYVSNIIIRLCSDEQTFRRERAFINKLNTILIEVVKQEWPSNWPSFVPDLVAAAKNSETMCENCMYILKLLSEEIFDFSLGEMTQAKINELKHSLNKEFVQIHGLCEFVLDRSQKVELVRATLQTLNAYLSWVPLGYIFEGNLIDRLLNLFPHPDFRNLALECLTEIGCLKVEEQYSSHFEKIFWHMMTSLQQMLPPTTDIPSAYNAGSDAERAFVLYLVQFLNGFLKEHMRAFESKSDYQDLLLMALNYMVNLSYVEDTEVFKVCLDFWQHFVRNLYHEAVEAESAQAAGANMFAFPAAQQATKTAEMHQRLYGEVLSRLRRLMVSRMAKPEEVIVVEDENGNVVKETLKDNDVIMQHKSMKETLVYLSHLDYEDTEQQMLQRLQAQLDGNEYSWSRLNTLCWAVGAISGTMREEQENQFLVSVIRDLLTLCETTRGKDHKAVIASNIMYVVGRYPRFLKEHWKFLKTVVNKLFEFMHESHPGVQDMACDTFLKISRSCKRKFVEIQPGEKRPFLQDLIDSIEETIKDLEPHQKNLFYEAAASMAGAESDPNTRENLLAGLMQLPNKWWYEIIQHAKTSGASVLREEQVMRRLVNVLQMNSAACRGIGATFQPQLMHIFGDMLEAYRLYSSEIGMVISQRGKVEAHSAHVKLMRSVKREALKLIECFVERSTDRETVVNQLVPGMVEPVLGDYAQNVPDARDHEVLSVFTTIIRKVKAQGMADYVPRLLEATFKCTLNMITENFEDYPDHRLKFFEMLGVVVQDCFAAVASLSNDQLGELVNAGIWAIRHQDRNVADAGLNLVYTLVSSFGESEEHANRFFSSYTFTLLSQVFDVMTDTFHKPGFKMQVQIIRALLLSIESPFLTTPLWDTSSLGPSAYSSNAHFVRESVIRLLRSAFPNMDPNDVATSVDSMFAFKNDARHFKNLLRDFLVQTRQFKNAPDANRDLYADELAAQEEQQRQRMAQVPGLLQEQTNAS